ncbi:hypothetical protein [Kaarinaea lacus]
MSVVLSVGFLDEMRRCDEEGYKHYTKVFEDIYSILEKNQKPRYKEPKYIEGGGWWAQVNPSDGIAYLQRLAAHLWWKESLPEPAMFTEDSPLNDPAIDYELELSFTESDSANSKGQNFQHLICHSPMGFWLPVKYKMVVWENKTSYGSSINLKKECEWIAQWLDLPLDIPLDNEELQDACSNPGKYQDGWKRFGIESYNCLLLHEACSRSIKLNSAICLH